MSRHPSASPSTPLAVALDAILIVVFAAIGRESHGQEWTGAMETATPSSSAVSWGGSSGGPCAAAHRRVWSEAWSSGCPRSSWA
nr:DUF3054 family protein [Mobilicoccus caccae]